MIFKLKSNHCITILNPHCCAPFKLCLHQSSNWLQTYLKPWSNQQQILPREHHKIGRHAQAFEPPPLARTWAALFVHGILQVCHWNLFKVSSINAFLLKPIAHKFRKPGKLSHCFIMMKCSCNLWHCCKCHHREGTSIDKEVTQKSQCSISILVLV